MDPNVFVGLTFGKHVDEFKDWAPCLGCMFGRGFPKSTRNTVMFAAAVGCKKEQPDNWKARLEINSKYCTPSLPASEIVTIQSQHEKKEYGFPCDQEPLKVFATRHFAKQRSLVSAVMYRTWMCRGCVLLSQSRLCGFVM